MKKIGLIGGVGWRSTVEYYRFINEEVARRRGGLHSAVLTLESLDLAQVRAYAETGAEEALVTLYADAARKLAASGAQMLALCSNAAHSRLPRLAEAVRIPFVHIADALIAEAHHRGYRCVGLLGTRETMERPFMADALRASGLRVLTPAAEERQWLHETIFTAVEQGLDTKSDQTELLEIIAHLAAAGADAAVLGCTELPLVIRQAKTPIPCLDSTRLHATAIVQMALQTPND